MSSVSVLVSLIISFTIFPGILIALLVGIFFAYKASKHVDPLRKKATYKKMWWSFATPFLVLIFTVIIWGLLQTALSLSSK